METKLQQEINNVLKMFPEYWNENTLLKNKLIEDVRAYNKNLIESLLSNELIRNTYSLQLSSGLVFKVEDFISMLRFKNYWDNSYTKYTNEVGLTSEGKYLKYNSDVVMDFPHKDSVLEAGMKKEDVGKKEIYYHNVIAKEEIDVLLDKKVLTNAKKFDKNGTRDTENFNENDNLIIKGNNLLALHTLKDRYSGKVKLVYIDPPYNSKSTASTFSYNNKFNRSTWLTFMKNRAEVSKNILKEDGFYCCSIDHHELFYLGVMLDEVFGEENRIGVVSVETNPKGRGDAKFLSPSSEYFIIYAKNHEVAEINGIKKAEEKLSLYTKEDEVSKYKLVPLRRTGSNSTPDKRPNLCYPIYYNVVTKEIDIETPQNNSDWIKILPDGGDMMRVWRWSKERLMSSQEAIEVVKSKNTYRIYVKDRVRETEKAKTMWYGSKYDASANGTRILQNLKLDGEFSYPKSIYLMKDILDMLTNENDLILDFHLGSGTTAEIAHKMNRRYLGVEQMNYINSVTIPRLQKVIEDNQSGVSQELGWEGGGSFVYAELHSLNESFVDRIQASRDSNALNSLLQEMKDRAYLNFKVDLEKMTSDNNGFHELSLKEQKDVLIQVLDMNQLYLNYSEIEDSQYDISDSVKAFNHSFYQKEGDTNE